MKLVWIHKGETYMVWIRKGETYMVWIHKGGHKKWMVRLKGRHIWFGYIKGRRKKIYFKNENFLIEGKIFEKCKIHIYEVQKKDFFVCYI